MALAYVGVGGAQTYTAAAATGTVPHGSPPVGQQEFMLVATKPQTMRVSSVTGWTSLGFLQGGAGSFGADAGLTCVEWLQRNVLTTGSEGTSSETINLTGNVANSTLIARIMHISKAPDSTLTVAFSSGADSSTGTAYSATHSTAIGLAAADLLLDYVSLPTDTAPTYGTEAFTASGATVTRTLITNPTNSTGNDIGGHLVYATVTGSSSNAVVHTITLSGTTTNAAGPDGLVRIRESFSTPATPNAPTAVAGPNRAVVTMPALPANSLNMRLYRNDAVLVASGLAAGVVYQDGGLANGASNTYNARGVNTPGTEGSSSTASSAAVAFEGQHRPVYGNGALPRSRVISNRPAMKRRNE